MESLMVGIYDAPGNRGKRNMKKKSLLMPLRKLHGRIHEYHLAQEKKHKFFKDYVRPLRKSLKKKSGIALLVMTPVHGNLGDHAIAQSIANMLNRLNIEYIEITGDYLDSLYRYNALQIMNGHPIFINGGGNIGTIWFGVELLHRSIISSNPDSSIFIMPNTAYFENSPWGEEELKNSIQIYNRHRSLFLYAREHLSYSVMAPLFNNVAMVPDMVFALNASSPASQRKGCLLCLRKDREKTLSDSASHDIYEQVKSIFDNHVSYTDMISKDYIPLSERSTELEIKYAEFRSAELVITDRLHGMIFCVITGTPCIIVNSKSPKILGCCNWVMNIPYIKFCEDVSKIKDLFEEIPKCNFNYDPSIFDTYYRSLEKQITSVIKKKEA